MEMDHDQGPGAWADTTGTVVRPAAWAAPSTRSPSGCQALSTDLTPSGSDQATRGRFAAAIGPCLALTAPAGMGQDERRTWIDAAFTALRHLPIDVIEAGARVAARTADHPSKIVPAVIAAADGEIAWRKRMNTPQPPASDRAVLPAPGSERGTAAELDAVCKRFAVGRYAKEQPRGGAGPTPMGKDPDRPCRAPTRADYLRLGVDPAVLDRMAAPSGSDDEEAA